MELTEQAQIIEHRTLYVRYLLMKLQEQDFHGVADAAMDLRDLYARHPDMRWPEIRL